MNQIKIGEFIAQLRHENNLTQEALGEKLGVANKTISRWENGNYMPNIEMLQILSETFHVSINELLCGERISDGDYREKADKNLVAALKSNVFSTKEKYAFWKKKWLKEHITLLVCIVVLVLIIFGIASYLGNALLCACVWIVFLIVYIKFQNDMVGYIEGKIYDAPNDCDKTR